MRNADNSITIAPGLRCIVSRYTGRTGEVGHSLEFDQFENKRIMNVHPKKLQAAGITALSDGIDAFVDSVRETIRTRAANIACLIERPEGIEQMLSSGKMLRTRLAGRFIEAGSASTDVPGLFSACTATELLHVASLCHDDVIDNARIRRGQSTLWVITGPSAAVLIGDMLLCEGMKLLLEASGGRYIESFVAKAKEILDAEIEQELFRRDRKPNEKTYLRLARGKTGPLFAFVASICGGDDEALSGALEEAGYRIGTAYQLSDDLLDILGTEEIAGKTLGTDSLRGKFTLPQTDEEGGRTTRQRVGELLRSGLKCLKNYPRAHEGLVRFLSRDLQPILDRHLRNSVELGA